MAATPLLWIQNLFNAIGGVVAKIYNNGSAVAPETTTTQVILDFTGATVTRTAGTPFDTLHVPLDSGGGGTTFVADTPLSLTAGHLSIGAATSGARGTISAVDKAKLDGLADWLSSLPLEDYRQPEHVAVGQGIDLLWNSSTKTISIQTTFDPTTLQTNTDSVTAIKTDKDGNHHAVFDVTQRGAVDVATTGTGTVTITEAVYAGMGATNTGITYQVAHIELQITGSDGASPSPGSSIWSKTYAGIIRRNRSASDSWEINTGIAELTGLAVGTAEGTVSIGMSLGGPHNGDLTFTMTSTLATQIYCDWVYCLKVYGGGRYA